MNPSRRKSKPADYTSWPDFDPKSNLSLAMERGGSAKLRYSHPKTWHAAKLRLTPKGQGKADVVESLQMDLLVRGSTDNNPHLGNCFEKKNQWLSIFLGDTCAIFYGFQVGEGVPPSFRLISWEHLSPKKA